MKVGVECYAGYRASETPQRIRLGERLVQVTLVIDRWMTPDYRYFRVEGDDGCAYVLRLHPDTGEWELL